jgi:hypothetical protein
MNEKGKNKTKIFKDIFNNEGIKFIEYPNGQLKVDKVNFWCTTEKWYDEKLRIGNVGINSFLKHIRNNDII